VLNRILESALDTREVTYDYQYPVTALIQNSATAPDEPASAATDAGQILLCSFEQIFVFPGMYLYRALERAFIL